MAKHEQPLPVIASDQPADAGLFVELGRSSDNDIRRLKRGTGPLMRQISSVIDDWRDELGVDAAVEVVPVVLLYREAED
jgi:hypothetical protein